jgi:hypothetical protein
MRRGPVWNSSGASSAIRYWLKLNWPTPPGSVTGVLIRKIPSAISWMFVPLCALLIMEHSLVMDAREV